MTADAQAFPALRRGRSFAEHGRYDDALRMFEKVQAMATGAAESAEALLLQGDVLVKRGRPGELFLAEELYAQALQMCERDGKVPTSHRNGSDARSSCSVLQLPTLNRSGISGRRRAVSSTTSSAASSSIGGCGAPHARSSSVGGCGAPHVAQYLEALSSLGYVACCRAQVALPSSRARLKYYASAAEWYTHLVAMCDHFIETGSGVSGSVVIDEKRHEAVANLANVQLQRGRYAAAMGLLEDRRPDDARAEKLYLAARARDHLARSARGAACILALWRRFKQTRRRDAAAALLRRMGRGAAGRRDIAQTRFAALSGKNANECSTPQPATPQPEGWLPRPPSSGESASVRSAHLPRIPSTCAVAAAAPSDDSLPYSTEAPSSEMTVSSPRSPPTPTTGRPSFAAASASLPPVAPTPPKGSAHPAQGRRRSSKQPTVATAPKLSAGRRADRRRSLWEADARKQREAFARHSVRVPKGTW